MTSTPAPFTLVRATEADMPELIRICWHSFPQIVRELLMGAPTEADLPRTVAQYYQEQVRSDPHALWVKVVDNATGRVAAGSHWRIFPGASAPAGADEDSLPPWLDEESRVKAQGILDEMNRARVKHNPEGYVHLHILFTDNDFRRQGAGDMMLKWGTEIADLLGVAGWVEASKDGTILYERHGFKVVDYQSSGGTFMRREPNALTISGGRAKKP